VNYFLAISLLIFFINLEEMDKGCNCRKIQVTQMNSVSAYLCIWFYCPADNHTFSMYGSFVILE
jgi:hypothetical protein